MTTDEANYANTLAEDGVVVIENYLDEDRCGELYAKISNAIENEEIDVVRGDGYSYNELANWGGAVANERSGRDDGMIDVFNLDSVVPDVASFKFDKTINNIINLAASESYSPDNVNTYWNRSVTATRDFHADTYGGKFKSFVYLTDVPNRSYGPFTFIKGSHKVSRVKVKTSSLVNKIKNKPSTDAVFYDEKDVEYYTAPKGTLIIANQAGYHRGHPQKEGEERMLMTTSYTPEEN
ncbi:hypothetical protein [Haladaptatus sp. DJG-WS-42]|uniref:hypothetical protein n=1 Tax=Haladaptatus sp. DJG-WS-42 TaxID=3120516 RepID=UPI0030D26794